MTSLLLNGDAGVRCATHFLNAMRPLDHREPSLAAALLVDDRVTIGLIGDGVAWTAEPDRWA